MRSRLIRWVNRLLPFNIRIKEREDFRATDPSGETVTQPTLVADNTGDSISPRSSLVPQMILEG